MRAAVVHGANDIRFEEVPAPRAGPGEVVVQVKACGVCTTDLKILAGQSVVRGLPAIPDHEVSGVIGEIGAGVTGFAKDQRGAVYPIASCGECFFLSPEQTQPLAPCNRSRARRGWRFRRIRSHPPNW
jgi:L-iditol 2-dehydrogenase